MSWPVQLSISIPGKVFLLGEYVALEGSTSLLACLAPQFELRASLAAESSVEGIALESPAGRYFRENNQLTRGWWVQFLDPHQGRGGFGASTAQFATVWSFVQGLQHSFAKPLDERQMWSEYRMWAGGTGTQPSGADLLAQVHGGFVSVQREPLIVQSVQLPFEDVIIVALRTGQKVPTHEHLHTLGELDLSQLRKITTETILAWNQGDQTSFFKGSAAFSEEQARLNLLSSVTQDLIRQLGQWPEILHVRGCGAMGADVLAIYLYQKNWAPLEGKLAKLGREYFVVSETAGLQMNFRLHTLQARPAADLEPSL